METCDKCGSTVKAYWRAYSKKTYKYIELCNHHYNEYKNKLKELKFIIIDLNNKEK